MSNTSYSLLMFILPAILQSLFAQRRIKDGFEVTADKKYMVYFLKASSAVKYISWTCGGALVSPSYIVTSAACVRDVQHLYVVAGYKKFVDATVMDNDQCVKNKKKKVTLTCVPKEYKLDYNKSEKWAAYDIAVVQVESPYDFKDASYLQDCSYIPEPIAINYDPAYEQPGRDAMALGWGHAVKYGEDKDNPDQNQDNLKYAPTMILDKQTCIKYFDENDVMQTLINRYMICTLLQGNINDKGEIIRQSDPTLEGCITEVQRLSGMKGIMCDELVYSDDELYDDYGDIVILDDTRRDAILTFGKSKQKAETVDLENNNSNYRKLKHNITRRQDQGESETQLGPESKPVEQDKPVAEIQSVEVDGPEPETKPKCQNKLASELESAEIDAPEPEMKPIDQNKPATELESAEIDAPEPEMKPIDQNEPAAETPKPEQETSKPEPETSQPEPEPETPIAEPETELNDQVKPATELESEEIDAPEPETKPKCQNKPATELESAEIDSPEPEMKPIDQNEPVTETPKPEPETSQPEQEPETPKAEPETELNDQVKPATELESAEIDAPEPESKPKDQNKLVIELESAEIDAPEPETKPKDQNKPVTELESAEIDVPEPEMKPKDHNKPATELELAELDAPEPETKPKEQNAIKLKSVETDVLKPKIQLKETNKPTTKPVGTENPELEGDGEEKTPGICQNDHGGPLVGWVGAHEALIGVATLYKLDGDLQCMGPYLFTSTSVQCNSAFLECMIGQENDDNKNNKTFRRRRRSNPHCERLRDQGYHVAFRRTSWLGHPDGPAENEIIEERPQIPIHYFHPRFVRRNT